MIRRLLRLVPRIPGSRRLWFSLALSLFLIMGFIEITDDVIYDPIEGDFETHQFDLHLLEQVAQLRTPQLTRAMTDLSAMGSVSVMTVLVIVMISLLYALRDWVGIAHLSVVSLGAAALPTVLKSIFGRDRPDLAGRLVEASGLSFPSGHSFGSSAVYLTLAFIAARYLKGKSREFFAYLLAIVIVSLIGLTRIYLGVHYPSDVFGGLCGGAAWSFLVAALFVRAYQADRNRADRNRADKNVAHSEVVTE